MTLTEKFVRRYAQRTNQNGRVVIITNGETLLVDAFKELGWSDPYIDPEQTETKATVEDTQRAVLPRPKGR